MAFPSETNDLTKKADGALILKWGATPASIARVLDYSWNPSKEYMFIYEGSEKTVDAALPIESNIKPLMVTIDEVLDLDSIQGEVANVSMEQQFRKASTATGYKLSCSSALVRVTDIKGVNNGALTTVSLEITPLGSGWAFDNAVSHT